MVRLIGIAGVARCGKNTVASMIKEHLGRTFIRAFADPVKTATAEIYGVEVELLRDGDRDVIDPYWGISYREMLQKVGTDCCRNILRDDIWVRRMQLYFEAMAIHYSLIIPDLRFPNEYEFVKDNGGVVWHIRRLSGKTTVHSDHASERSLQIWDDDVVIDNDGDLAALAGQVKLILDRGDYY